MAHFARRSVLRTPPVFPTGRTGHRTIEYGSLAVLDFQPNCTHVQKSFAFNSERNV